MDEAASESVEPLDSFLGKWRARWPEWELLAVFVPASRRDTVAAWFTLLQELGDAAWAGREPAPGLAKLAWWQEELLGWSRGARRHPLGAALQRLAAPWDALGRSLAALPATRAPASAGDDVRALEPFAGALLACEAALFGEGGAEAPALAAVVDDLRRERALAQGGPPPQAAAVAAGLSLPRRLHGTALRQRLRGRGDGGGAPPAPGLRLLLAGWRAARRR